MRRFLLLATAIVAIVIVIVLAAGSAVSPPAQAGEVVAPTRVHPTEPPIEPTVLPSPTKLPPPTHTPAAPPEAGDFWLAPADGTNLRPLVGQTVRVYARANGPANGFTLPQYVQWEWPGGAATDPFSVELSRKFVFNNPGQVEIRARAFYPGGGSLTDTLRLEFIQPVEGVELVGPSGTVPVDTAVTFTATVSPTNASGPVTYEWVADMPTSDEDVPTATFRWSSSGTYEVQVTVNNAGGEATDWMEVVVNNIQLEASDMNPETGDPVKFVASIVTPSDYTGVNAWVVWQVNDDFETKVITLPAIQEFQVMLPWTFEQNGDHLVAATVYFPSPTWLRENGERLYTLSAAEQAEALDQAAADGGWAFSDSLTIHVGPWIENLALVLKNWPPCTPPSGVQVEWHRQYVVMEEEFHVWVTVASTTTLPVDVLWDAPSTPIDEWATTEGVPYALFREDSEIGAFPVQVTVTNNCGSSVSEWEEISVRWQDEDGFFEPGEAQIRLQVGLSRDHGLELYALAYCPAEPQTPLFLKVEGIALDAALALDWVRYDLVEGWFETTPVLTRLFSPSILTNWWPFGYRTYASLRMVCDVDNLYVQFDRTWQIPPESTRRATTK